MKCPRCAFVCADSKDLCPKCLLDLRASKSRQGIAISNPHARYKELLAASHLEAKPKSTPHSAPTTQKFQLSQFAEHGRAFFQNILKKIPKRNTTEKLPEAPRATPNEEQADPPTLMPPPTPPTVNRRSLHAESQFSTRVKPDVLDLTDNEDGLEEMLDSMLQDQEHFELATEEQPILPTATNEDLQFDIEFAEEDDDEDIQEEFVLFAEDEEDELPEETSDASNSQQQIWELNEDDEELSEELRWNVEEETPATLSSHRFAPLQSSGSEDADIDALFDASWDSYFPVTEEISLAIENMRPASSRNDIEVLFNLAFESLDTPDAQKVLFQPVETKTQLLMETPELLEQAEKAAEMVDDEDPDGKSTLERLLESSDQFVVLSRSESEKPDHAFDMPARVMQRSAAFLIDVVYMLLAAAIIAGLPLLTSEFTLAQLSAESLSLLRGTAVWFFLLLLFYPPLCLLLRSETFGQSLTACVFRGKDGLRLTRSQKILLGLELALSIVCGGFLLPLLRCPSLHEWLNQARTFQQEETEIS
jgi:hypothetical protein